MYYRYYRRKGFRRFVREDILELNDSPFNKSLVVGLGVFVGISPLWGHTVVVLALATLFRLNRLLAFLFSNVSFPPFIPFIIAGSLFMRAPFVGGSSFFHQSELNMDLVKHHIVQYLVGSFVLALLSAVLIGSLSYVFFLKFSKKS